MDLNRRKLLAVAILQHRQKARHRRRRWEHERNKAKTQLGQYQRLLHELRLDSARFQKYFRLTVEQFDVLLQRLGPRMTGVATNDRKPISSSQRLSICLWYLASGDSYESIAYSFRVGVSIVGDIVLGVSQAILDCLLNDFMPVPKEADWKAIAEDFLELWNFPNCIGAVDGKHIIIKPPANSGSLYYNYKGSFSIVLMAVVDARCRFRLLDVGAHGRSSDKGLLSNSLFGQALRTAKLSIPPDKHLPGAEHLGSLPYVFVGDEAFPLLRNLMRPYPGKNLSREHQLYNYRLSRARRLVKYAFSILTSQFRIFQRAMDIEPVAAELFVRTACILHNFMRWDLTEDDINSISDDEAGEGLLPVQRLGSNNSTRKSYFIRDKFAQYFSSPAGAVPWQQDD